MKLESWILGGSWVIFLVWWVISAVSAKRNIYERKNVALAGVRLVVFLAVVILIRAQIARHQSALSVSGGSPLVTIGVALTVLGIMVAIWARIYLGRNWGMPMSHKADPDLVTGGPYRLIRHPIYSGIMMAYFGTAMATVWWILIPFALMSIYFVYSAGVEEKRMAAEFPEQYPAYKAATKRFIPFLV